MLAKNLAQKQYYLTIRSVIEKNLNELNRFQKKYKDGELEKIYDTLNEERKQLVVSIEKSTKEKIREWKEEVDENNNFYPENLRFETEQGDMVRSKSEVIIANLLYKNKKDISYKYERPLEVVENGRKKLIYPDFTIINIHTGKITYWEHAGKMDDSKYANEFVKKINLYIANGLCIGRDVIITFETLGNPLDIGVAKQLVGDLLCGK